MTVNWGVRELNEVMARCAKGDDVIMSDVCLDAEASP